MTVIEARFVDANMRHGLCQVEVDDDKIIEIRRKMNREPDIRFPEEIILVPGIIDLHTHLRYGQDYKEDINTGTRAAINGGVVRVMTMPNNPLGYAPVDSDTYMKKLEWAEKGNIPVHIYAGIGPGTEPFEEAEHYKVFMAESVGELFFQDFETLDETLEKYQDCQVTFHCEDPVVIEEKSDNDTHEKRRPNVAESTAVQNAISLGMKYDLKVMLAHVSTKEAIHLINSAPQYMEIIVEATPHHLILNENSKKSLLHGEKLKINPPLRSSFDSDIMIQSLKQRIIHHVGSDHAPHTLEEKLGSNPSGIPGLDNMGQVFGYLNENHEIPLTTLCRTFSYNPAKFLGIKHGLISLGYEASFTAIHFKDKEISDDVETKAGFSAYKGMMMPKVPFVMAQGRIVKEEGKIII